MLSNFDCGLLYFPFLSRTDIFYLQKNEATASDVFFNIMQYSQILWQCILCRIAAWTRTSSAAWFRTRTAASAAIATIILNSAVRMAFSFNSTLAFSITEQWIMLTAQFINFCLQSAFFFLQIDYLAPFWSNNAVVNMVNRLINLAATLKKVFFFKLMILNNEAFLITMV